MMPLTLPSGTGMRARHFTPMVLALALAGTALVVHTVGKWMNYTRAPSGWSESADRVPVQLGSISLKVPANLMRRVEERIAGGPVERLSLAVLWPSMDGYSEFNARLFADSGDRSPVMLIGATATGALPEMNTSERLERVWMSLASGDPLPGPAGLALLPLPGDAESGTGFVAHRAEAGTLFAARCFTPRDAALAANCERSIRVAPGLFVTYRFRQALLEHWRGMDAAVTSLIAELRPEAAS
ncbi:hypothetical protein [Stappia sp. MMSF_3263]|uniref:hypothetical protein n=1 Tax=Stappia sp. MMSF_3263 TaxID=3046693 RepID=UPI00273E161D|nr:hypothetical protein [Stappia sp. MMSF_3263]